MDQMDETTFKEELVAHLDMVYRFAHSVTRGNKAEAEDLVHDTLERAIRYRASFSPAKGTMKQWLFRILTNLHSTKAQKSSREPSTPNETIEAKLPPAKDATENLADRISLREVVHSLQDKFRLPIILHYLEGHSCSSVAETLGLSLSAVKVRLLRGRKEIQNKLKEPRR